MSCAAALLPTFIVLTGIPVTVLRRRRSISLQGRRRSISLQARAACAEPASEPTEWLDPRGIIIKVCG